MNRIPKLVNGMTELIVSLCGDEPKRELVLKIGNVLAIFEQFILDDINFTDEEREFIFNHAKSIIQNEIPTIAKPLCKNCGKRWGQHGGEWCTPGNFKGTRYEPDNDAIPETMR